MTQECGIDKTNVVEIARNTQGTPTAKLIAVLIASGITDTKTLSEITGLKPRAIQCARSAAQCAQLNAHAQHNAPGAQQVAPSAAQCAPKPEALVCADKTTRATKESFQDTPSLEGRKNPPTPQGGTGDDLHRKAYLAGIELKGGKVAKSARSTQRTVGELDGSNGITFADGEMTVDAATAAKIRAKFPGVDVVAVCNKAAPEVGRTGYPTRDFAAAVIGKWAQIQIENKRSAPASKGEIVPFKVTGVRHARPRDEVANA